MASTAALIQQFIVALKANQRNTYSYVAALTFYSYDIILSSGQEIKYIWGSKWSPVKALYFIIRYYCIVNLIAIVAVYSSTSLSLEDCQRFFLWSIPGGAPVFTLALNVILLLRIFALYNRNKQIFTILLVLVLAESAVALWATVILTKRLATNAIRVPPPWRGCASELPMLKFLLITYILNFALSLLFLAMTLWKLVENHRRLGHKLIWKTLYNTDNISPLLLAFVRDGSIFFALGSIGTLLGLIALFVLHGPVQAMFHPWILALYSYSGAHLILDLRATGNADSTWNETLSPQCGPDGFLHGIRFTSSILH